MSDPILPPAEPGSFALKQAYRDVLADLERHRYGIDCAIEILQQMLREHARKTASVCPTESPSRSPEVMSGRLGGEEK